ncbi:MAG TPA: amino acid transporter, partial [Pedococcus sp.]|nr:amino acid transporter [Pedococcus sp.]
MNVESTPASTGLPAGHRGPDGTYVDKGLKGGAIGLLSSVVIGMSSTAPAYSLAATLGFVVIAVGVKAPAMMLLA